MIGTIVVLGAAGGAITQYATIQVEDLVYLILQKLMMDI